MKFVAISDLHNQISKVNIPECNALLISGDLSNKGTPKEIVKFNEDLLPIKKKANKIIVIAGNHDRAFQEQSYVAKSLLTNVDHYLEHDMIEINGIRIFGSPFTPTFGYGWAFNVDRGVALKEKWSKIPYDADILITHGQPYGILDEVPFGGHVGDQDLLDAILIRPSIKVVIGGHLHAGYGHKEIASRLFINASTCDETYAPINPPIVFDFDPTTKTYKLE